MRVKTLREHNNTYGVEHGVPVKKAVGREYDVPDAMGKTLSTAGLVEEVKAKAKAGEAG